jgi:putative Holliday junction resolvase
MKIEDNDRIMAIDYGLKRVGIALSDPLKKFAYPYKTLDNDKNLFINLVKIINDMDVSLIILGIPNDKKENVNSLSNKINEFKSELLDRIKVEIIFWDESFSSKIAQQKILESVSKKKARRNKSLLDMHSAAIILSEYLEQSFN